MPRKKSLPNIYRFVRRHTPELLIGLGVFALSLSIIHKKFYDRSLRLNAELAAIAQEQTMLDQARRAVSRPVAIQIGEIVSTTVDPGQIIDGEWSIAENAATFWTEGGYPGIGGNIVLYGHNTRTIFSRLRSTRVGQEIVITSADGSQHGYRVTEIHQVTPDRVDFLQPTQTEMLTVYTCTGFLDSQRFVVRAERLLQD